MWAGFGHWSGVRTLYVMHSAAPLCLAVLGFLPLARVGAGGQMGAAGAGGPFVYQWWRGPCFGLSVLSVRNWGILTGLAFRISGTD